MAESFTSAGGKTTASMRESLTDALAKLKEAGRGEVLRKAAASGALVLYDEMHARVPVDEGTLKRALYRFWDQGDDARQTYLVGPSKGKAPHWHLIEYGHWRVNVVARGENGEMVATKERLPTPVWVPAKPYIRPTIDAKGSEAVQAMKAEFGRALREAAGDSRN